VTIRNLHHAFVPQSIAVIGASCRPGSVGTVVLDNILKGGFAGDIWAVNSKYTELNGRPCYAAVKDLPAAPDLAVIMTPAVTVPGLIGDLGARGTRAAVVLSAGLTERNGLRQKMLEAARPYLLRIVGPNCMGLFNLHLGLNLTEISPLPAGPIAMVSQSGNVGVTLWDQARKHDVGFSCFVGFGNQADIPMHEYIDYLGQHEPTKVITVYLEGLRPGSGDAFFETCARVSRVKPIVVLKGGRTDAGRRAAESHTASLSSSERVYSALFEEAGIVEVQQMELMLPVAEALMRCPPMRGDDVAIVGSGGGHSTVCTDEVESVGLLVPAFSDGLQEELGRRLPEWAPKRNPVDMTGAYTKDPSLFATLTELVIERDPRFSAAVNYGLYGLWKDGQVAEDSKYDYVSAAPLIGQLQARLDRPIIFYTPYADRPHASFTAMREAGVPCLESVAAVGAALAALRKRGRFLARAAETPATTPRPPVSAGNPALDDYATEVGAYALLARHGVQTPEALTAQTPAEAAALADRLGYPVVLKGVLPGVAHKSDVGGVRTGLGDSGSLLRAAEQMAADVERALGAGALAGYMVTRDLGRRRELIVGVRRDVSLDTLGLIGLGGVLTEALDDVAVCLLPATPQRVERALSRLKSARAWGAFRGEPAVPAQAVADLLNRLQSALLSDDAIDSVECNPVMVVDERVIPVDAAIAAHNKE